MEYRVLKGFELESGYSLRKEVFVDEQKVPVELEIEEKDSFKTTIHVGVFEDDVLIAVGRILDFGSKKVHIGRIAVKFEYRKHNVGRFLIENMEKTILSSGVLGIVCELDAQVQVVGFYEKLGYSISTDEEFLDAGILHKTMFKLIK